MHHFEIASGFCVQACNPARCHSAALHVMNGTSKQGFALSVMRYMCICVHIMYACTAHRVSATACPTACMSDCSTQLQKPALPCVHRYKMRSEWLKFKFRPASEDSLNQSSDISCYLTVSHRLSPTDLHAWCFQLLERLSKHMDIPPNCDELSGVRNVI